MLFNAWFPLLEIVAYWFIFRFVYRCLDRCGNKGMCNYSAYNTSTKTLNNYMEIYAGGVYYMHFKYAAIMNICYVTLMYGFGMPILYPIAVYALVVLYLSEKALLYYSYRQPPTYDERLSNTVVRMLMGAPVFGLMFGYWVLSSKQLIDNDHLEPREFGDDTPKSQHLMQSVFQPSGWEGPAWPVLMMAFVTLFICIFHKYLNTLFDKMFPCWTVGDYDPNEEIGDYWHSLSTEDLYWSYHEERKFRILFFQVYNKHF
jgi:hypothetical protein